MATLTATGRIACLLVAGCATSCVSRDAETVSATEATTSEAPAPRAVAVERRAPLGLPILYRDDAFVDMCGGVYNYQDIESPLLNQFLEPKGFNAAFANANEPATVLIRWRSIAQMESELVQGSPDDPYDGGSLAKRSGQHWCSGTLLKAAETAAGSVPSNSALILTAAHCFEPDRRWTPFKIASGDLMPEKVAAHQMNVVFNYQWDATTDETHLDTVEYRIDELVEYGFSAPGKPDYALVRIVGANANGADIRLRAERDGRALATTNPSSGAKIAIIQHPAGKPKKIDAGTVRSISADYMDYDNIDTRGGSSGSGVLGRDGRVVAVHIQGGCEAGDANGATPVSAIVLASARL